MNYLALEHRAIDRFVDAHPSVRGQRERFPVHLRRFSGILLDVFYDHFLTRHWQRFSAEALKEVTGSVYGALREHAELLSPRLARIAPHMIRDDWLGNYGERANVERALLGIARRFRRATPLAEGIRELEAREQELEQHFLELFPLLQSFVADRRS